MWRDAVPEGCENSYEAVWVIVGWLCQEVIMIVPPVPALPVGEPVDSGAVFHGLSWIIGSINLRPEAFYDFVCCLGGDAFAIYPVQFESAEYGKACRLLQVPVSQCGLLSIRFGMPCVVAHLSFCRFCS